VQERLGPDFQIGHSYFMQRDIATAEGLHRIWRRAIAPLLEEYFHTHRDRDEILAELTPAQLLRGMAADGSETIDTGDVFGEDADDTEA
jgi:hypothetical protein